MVLDAEAERHARGADIGRIGEDLGHREHAILRVEIVDREFAVLQRMARVERRPQRDLAESSAIATVSALKVEPIS